MENKNEQKTIKESILATIKSGQVKMRPRWHFILKAILAILGAIIIFLTVLYLASFIIFILRQTGVLFMPAFGMEGWFAFFSHLPVFLIILLAVFIIVLELLVRHYAFAYRRPLFYSALGIFTLIVVGGLAVANTSLHGDLSKRAEKDNEFLAGKLYREYEAQIFRDVHRGRIMQITQRGFLMNNQRKEALTITVTRKTRLPLGSDFYLGDIVVVFGPRDGDEVQAFGIQKTCEMAEACE